MKGSFRLKATWPNRLSLKLDQKENINQQNTTSSYTRNFVSSTLKKIKAVQGRRKNVNPIRTKTIKRLLVSGCKRTNIEKNRNLPTFLCIDYLKGLQLKCTKSSFSTVRDFRVVERSWHGFLRIFSLFVRPASCPPSLNLQIF